MSIKNIDAPLALLTDTVHPEWLDYNQHMSEGYYGVAFCHVTDAFMDFIGLHAEYRSQTQCTIYTVETHINYLRELKVGNQLHFTTQLLGFDQKRMLVFHEMYHTEQGYLAATMEAMLLHVNHEPRVVVMPTEIMVNVEAVFKAHVTLPRPPQAGRSISMPAKKDH